MLIIYVTVLGNFCLSRSYSSVTAFISFPNEVKSLSVIHVSNISFDSSVALDIITYCNDIANGFTGGSMITPFSAVIPCALWA